MWTFLLEHCVELLDCLEFQVSFLGTNVNQRFFRIHDNIADNMLNGEQTAIWFKAACTFVKELKPKYTPSH